MRRLVALLAATLSCAAVLSTAPAAFAARPSAAAAPPALALGESRPVETALGNPALPSAQPVWLEMIRSAGHTLDFEEFYFANRPGELLQPVMDEIGRAAARGVKVRLMFDASM